MAQNPIHLLRLGALRTVTTAAVRSPPLSETTKSKPLYRWLSEGSSVADTLDRWSAQGGAVTKPHLIKQVRALCKFRRHKEALEVMDWIAKIGLDMTSGNHALYLDLLSKVNGIDSAENYFLSLSDPAKDDRTYGALLYCYCRKRMKNKAIALYQKMKELNLPPNIFVHNNLMSLYMKLDQHDKVPDLYQEMKARHISPDNCSYRVLIKSYASLNDIDSVERAIQDMEGSGVSLDWFTYCCLAEIYISAHLVEKAVIALKQAELVMGGRDLSPFSLLIRLYAEVGGLTEVKRAWKLLKARAPRPKNMLYLVVLQALRKLDDMDALEQCFKEWECNGCSGYDARVVDVVVEAFLDKNMVKEAELVREKWAEKGEGLISDTKLELV